MVVKLEKLTDQYRLVKLEKLTDQYRRGKAVDASKLKLVAGRLLAAANGSHETGSLEALLQANLVFQNAAPTQHLNESERSSLTLSEHEFIRILRVTDASLRADIVFLPW